VASDGLGELQELGHAGFLGIVRSSTGSSSCASDKVKDYFPRMGRGKLQSAVVNTQGTRIGARRLTGGAAGKE
jgi:hypothetical protein